MNPTLTMKLSAVIVILSTMRRGLDAVSHATRRNKLVDFVVSQLLSSLNDAIDKLEVAANDARDYENDIRNNIRRSAELGNEVNNSKSMTSLYQNLFRDLVPKPDSFSDVSNEWKNGSRINAIKLYRGKFNHVMPLVDAKTLCENAFGPLHATGS